ncbi:glycosyltransferase [Horticoccus sp. 23ND18S-11]|uniref:glycosyltransferase n=1 Tax=Horticoccus sp. 23ND18S-11 TaxID=3391832 RepID=UPI0039C91C84
MHTDASDLPVSRPRRHVSVCVCTYKRPGLLERLLESLEKQQTGDTVTFSVVIADNDEERSAEPSARRWAAKGLFPVVYAWEPIKNIALVRNKALANATGEFVAFVDDDEFVVPHWLENLLATLDKTDAAGVLAPVRPHFDSAPPSWLIKGRFCERTEYPTGTPQTWVNCRTGNVLFRRSILDGTEEAFRRQFGIGGEDQDFFRRMIEKGHVFVWCNEAPAYESVPPSRWTRSFLLSRALLRGRISMRRPEGRAKLIATSFVAMPLYTLAIVGSFFVGHHLVMRNLVRFCDHLGRILTLLRINPVRERPM